MMASEGAGPWELEESMIKAYFGFTLDNKEKLVEELSMVNTRKVIIFP